MENSITRNNAQYEQRYHCACLPSNARTLLAKTGAGHFLDLARRKPRKYQAMV